MRRAKNRLIIVGASGYWGSILTRAAIQLLGASRVVAFDIDQRGMQTLKERLHTQGVLKEETQLECHDKLEDVLKDEANQHFVIAVPPQLHSQVATQILSKGRHILLAKPMALSAQEAVQLQQLANQNGSLLMVDHTFVFHPAVQKMITEVSGGRIGVPKSFYAGWLSRGKIQEVDVIWDLGPHPLSILLEFWQLPIEVSCKVQDEHNGVVSEATLLLTEKHTGNTATIHLSWMDGDKSRYFKVRGSHHTIVFDDTQEMARKLYLKGGKTDGHALLHNGFKAPIYDLAYPQSQEIALAWEEPLKKELAAFMAATPKTAMLNNAAKGVRCVKLLEAAHDSISKGAINVEA